MKRSKQLMLKCITALMITTFAIIGGNKLANAAFIETVKSYEIDSYISSGSSPTYVGTRYLYKELRFSNTYWLINKTFYKTDWTGLLSFEHYYQSNIWL